LIALFEAHRAGLLGPAHWSKNLIAGLVVGVVALPLSMAFAIASGARPEQGIYTAIVAGIMVSLFGGSRLQIAGPTGAFIAILAGITATYGIDGLQVATLMAGMTDAETERTAELFNELRGKHSLVVVEHDMDFVQSIALDGKVTVLCEGSVLAEGKMSAVQADPRVIEVYLGR